MRSREGVTWSYQLTLPIISTKFLVDNGNRMLGLFQDEHKIALEELAQRLCTNYENVSIGNCLLNSIHWATCIF